MRNAAVFVLSSRWEGLPGVLIQAMACGCPIVSTNCASGPAEILEDGRYGRLVDVGDIQGISEAIDETLDAPIRLGVDRRAMEFGVESAIESYLRIMLGSGNATKGGI